MRRTQFELIMPAGQSCSFVERVTVEAHRRGQTLSVRYWVKAQVEAIAIPEPDAPIRADLLWHRSCFEAFIRTPCTEPYIEYNFSPSSRWAAYAFDSFRDGMRDYRLTSDPVIDFDKGEGWFSLEAETVVPDAFGGDWLLQLSAIIEATGGTKSFWALRHKQGEPDFHHKDCFAMLLPKDQTCP